MTESDFVKMLYNARINAEEEYRKAKPFTPVIYESQIEGMKSLWGNEETWDRMEGWLRSTWEVINDEARIIQQRESWRKIHEMLENSRQDRINMTYIAPMRSGKTWLGSQIGISTIDEHLRIQEVQEVPGVRDIGWSYGPVHFDRKSRATTFDHGSAHRSSYEKSDAVQLKEWLQLRGICRRASSCGVA